MAFVGVRREQAQVVAHRTGERVAVLDQLTAGRQQREHGGVHRGNAGQQRGGLGAQRLGRGQEIVVPLEVKALPAGAEEGIEADVVVAGGGADIALVEQFHALVADHLPVVLQGRQLGEMLGRNIGRGRHAGEQIHQAVVRRHDGGVVGQLAKQLVLDPAAVMHVQTGRDKSRQDEVSRGQQMG